MKRPTRDELISLRTRRMTREDIALHYSVSPATVRRWFKEMDVPAPEPKRGYVADRERFVADEGLTALEHARVILGPRVMERLGHGYYLDGKPAAVADILHAADAVINAGPE